MEPSPTPAQQVAELKQALAQFEKNATAIIALARELLTKEERV